MSIKETEAFKEKKNISGELPKEIKEQEPQPKEEMAEDELGLVVGGTRESAIEFLERYAPGIPIGRVQEEAEATLRALKGEEE
ncbi:MAG: hypothetical protein KBA53_01615 [Thermoclostridium sp.]|nr:hypothetical protein [Thermoclostridium sp.]